jgi:hypothetical protein
MAGERVVTLAEFLTMLDHLPPTAPVVMGAYELSGAVSHTPVQDVTYDGEKVIIS